MRGRRVEVSPPAAGRAARRGSRGMVTAELAVSTLAVLAVLTMLCWAIYLVVMQLRCLETAGEVARQAARGDRAAVRRAEQDAPAGARVQVKTGPQTTAVTVTVRARPFAKWLVVVPLHAEAQVATEPSAAEAR